MLHFAPSEEGRKGWGVERERERESSIGAVHAAVQIIAYLALNASRISLYGLKLKIIRPAPYLSNIFSMTCSFFFPFLVIDTLLFLIMFS